MIRRSLVRLTQLAEVHANSSATGLVAARAAASTSSRPPESRGYAYRRRIVGNRSRTGYTKRKGRAAAAAAAAAVADPGVPVASGVQTIVENAKAKFDETVDLSVQLGVDPRHADQLVRGATVLPHGTGKSVRVAVFATGDKAEEARAAGAEIVGAEDLARLVREGTVSFDRCIATPDMMPKVVAPLGRILGPKGLMPNPKLGSVTNDIAKAVRDAAGGQIQYRVEKAGIVHVPVGKVSFGTEKLLENIGHVRKVLTDAKPTGAKGVYFRGLSVSSTMGKGVKLNVDEWRQASRDKA